MSRAALYLAFAKVFLYKPPWGGYLKDFFKVEPPQEARYTFGEKVEYWSVVWGTVIMAVTGFMMWNPISTLRFLPGEAIPAAKAAHGGEAVLAVLAIIIWHFYHVHIKTFNKSMFTGKLLINSTFFSCYQQAKV